MIFNLSPWHKIKPQFDSIIIWSMVVGFLTGLLSSSFKIIVHYIILQRQQITVIFGSYAIVEAVIPSLVSGIMVYVSFCLIRSIAPETAGSGIPHIEGSLDNRLEIRWRRVLPVKFIGGILSISSGMIAGFEGPTIQMGGSIGKMVSDFMNISSEKTRILIASGASAGLTAAFNAPIAGIVFMMEEVHPKFKSGFLSYSSMIASSIVATIVVRTIFGQNSFMSITHFDRVPLNSLWMFIILGVGLGIIGYYFNFFIFQSLKWFENLQGITYHYLGLFIGIIIGFIGYFFPVLVGSGDEIVIWSFNTEASLLVLLLILLTRFILTIICYGSGEIGGIFAPMLALATIFSLSLAKMFYFFFPLQLPQPGVLAIAGMGGLVCATVRAPLTAVILTIELTDNFFVILPMLVTCLFATVTSQLLGGEPIYSVLLRNTLQKHE